MTLFQDFSGQKQNSKTLQDFPGCGHHALLPMQCLVTLRLRVRLLLNSKRSIILNNVIINGGSSNVHDSAFEDHVSSKGISESNTSLR